MYPIRRGSARRMLLGLAALLILLPLILVACGGNDDDDDAGGAATDTPSAAATPTATEGEPATSTPSDRPDPPGLDETESAALAEGMNAFASDFYHTVTEGGDENLVFSPFSIELAFSMVYAGARGETESQMADVLKFLVQEDQHPAASAIDGHLSSLDEAETSGADEQGEVFQLRIANAVWGQVGFPFLDIFVETLETYYGSGVQPLDFAADPEAARKIINDWVAENTEDKIKDILAPGSIKSLTRLVLANAIYFNAAWLFPFNEDATADAPFTLLDGSQVDVQMMSQRAARIPYLDGDGYQAVSMPYTGNAVEMTIIVPDAGNFDEIEAGLTAEFIENASTSASIHDVNLSMPRYDFKTDLDLVAILPGMGMPAPFSDADFSGINQGGGLFISSAVHSATIAVDEKGTEATAATVIAMDESAMEQAEVTLDRPFIFAIVDNETGTILFLGRVMNPTE